MYCPCCAPVGNQEPYNHAPHTNSYRAFPMHSGTVPSKNPMPYGGPNTENGPLNNSVGQMPNQSTQVQSASVPPTSQVVNNQDHLQGLESQFVVFREKEISLNEKTNQLEEEKTVTLESLSTERNKSLALEANISEFQLKVENLESELKTTNENFSSITSDIACSKKIYELSLIIKTTCLSQKTANTPHHPANSFPQPPVSQPPSLNYQPYWQQQPPRLPHNSGTMYNHPPGQFIPNSNADNYSLPPERNTSYVDRTMPPHEQPNQSNKISNKDIYPPTNQANKPLSYSNGTGFVPPVSQYGHPPNSGMHARYLPSSLSPNISQSNVSSSTGATQFNQASNTLLTQNRMGYLPQPPAAQKRRLDPDSIPCPISCSTTDTNSISDCNTSSASMSSLLSKRECIFMEKTIMDILRCKPLVVDEWIIACYKDGIQMWFCKKTEDVFFIDDNTKQCLSTDEHPDLKNRFKEDFLSVLLQACADELEKEGILLNEYRIKRLLK